MAITGSDTITRVDTYGTLPMTAKDGSVAFAEDTARHYMFSGGTWYLIPNITGMAPVRFWDAGTFKNGSPNTGDMIIFTDSTTTTSGDAVFSLTDNHTPSGIALCSSILSNSCVGNFVDSTGVFSQGVPTVAGTLKTVTISTTKQVQTGVVVLTLTVVGTVTQPVSPNGTIVRFFGIGVSI